MDVSKPTSLFYKRRLPHYFMENHPVFLTWRLKFSLPVYVTRHLNELKTLQDKKTQALSDEYKVMQGFIFHKKVFGYYDTQLGLGQDMPDLLRKTEIADIVKESLLFHNKSKYMLHAFCVMPNHVHALITPISMQPDLRTALSSITQTWKRHTARQVNLLLNRKGSLWSEETYDHMVRNENEFSRIVSYILLNPVKANLTTHWEDWRYSWISPELKEIMMIALR